MAQVSKKPCEICEQAPGTHYCLDCEQCYCDSCKFLHKKQKSSRNHEFQLSNEVIPEVKSKCNDHKESFNLFCTTCDVPVCGKCVTGKHNSHTFAEIKDRITQLRETLSHKLQPQLNDLKRNIGQVTSSLHKFEGEVVSVVNALEEEGVRMKVMIDKYVAEMTKSIRNETEQRKTRIEYDLSDMKTEMKYIETLDIKRKELEKARSDGSLIAQLQDLQTDIDKLRLTGPPEIPCITFIPGKGKEKDVRQLFGTFDLSTQVTEKKWHLFRCSSCGKEERDPINPYRVVHDRCKSCQAWGMEYVGTI